MFRFCPKCGGYLKQGEPLICSQCDFHFWQNSKPTVTALIINSQGEILLVKRAIEPALGKWDFPGGFLENGEDPIDGLIREMQEELEIEVSPEEIIGIYIDQYEFDGTTYYTFNVFYKCKIAQGSPKASGENSAFKWFNPAEIPLDEIAFKHQTQALLDYLSRH